MKKINCNKKILLLAAVTLIFNACTISKSSKTTSESLVGKDEPVFDKRFEEVSFEQLKLDKFWVSSGLEVPRDPVPVDNFTFANLSQKVKNSVVNIYSLRVEEREARVGISPNDLLPIRIPIVSHILDIIPFKVPIPFRSEGISLGSGFIINNHGFILTNAHVIHNSLDIRVVLSEGRKEYPAKIIGIDHLTDTALIKIEADFPLSPIPLGNSDQLRTGEMVLAIGNPLGLKHSVSSGLLSAKERTSPNPNDKYVNFLQTDSAINPGSSGGPLINLYGEVIGINTAIVSDAQLIGFAVPINTAKEVMPLLVLGKTERGWFGAMAQPLTLEDAVELGYENDHGLKVTGVEEESPADKAELQANDIIVKFNGQSIDDFIKFRRKLLGLTPGANIQLTIFRAGKTFEVSSTLAQKPQAE
jgi:serine protease Do